MLSLPAPAPAPRLSPVCGCVWSMVGTIRHAKRKYLVRGYPLPPPPHPPALFCQEYKPCRFPCSASLALKVCELVEVDGLSRFVYSDGPVAPLEKAGMLQREPYAGSMYTRKLVLAELAYAES